MASLRFIRKLGSLALSAAIAWAGLQRAFASDPIFLPPVTYSPGGHDGVFYGDSAWTVIGDVNGDGKPDIVVANWCSKVGNSCPSGSNVGVRLNNGDGSFQSAMTYSSGGQNAFVVRLADVNNDGKLDIVVANGCPVGASCAKGSSIGVLLGNGDGTFQPVKKIFVRRRSVMVGRRGFNG